jgi:hypothetical protein
MGQLKWVDPRYECETVLIDVEVLQRRRQDASRLNTPGVSPALSAAAAVVAAGASTSGSVMGVVTDVVVVCTVILPPERVLPCGWGPPTAVPAYTRPPGRTSAANGFYVSTPCAASTMRCAHSMAFSASLVDTAAAWY